MNLIFNLPSHQRSSLSKLGLNVFGLGKPLPNRKRPPAIPEVMHTIYLVIYEVRENHELIYYDICDSTFFKKETLLKGIWTCKNNIYPSRLITIMKEETQRNLLIERLELMLNILTTSTNN